MMLEADDDGIEDVSSDELEEDVRSRGSPATVQRQAQAQAYYTNYSQPAAVTASRGLAGIFDEDGGNILDTRSLPENAVLVNVYDVSDTEIIQRINRFTTANNAVLVGGVFHGGVEVYGREWSYGCTEDARTGVGAVPPRCHPQHTYRSTVHIGNTNLSRDQVGALLARLAVKWPGNQYSLIHKNCLSFCNELLQELGLRRVPGWVDRAPRAASQVDNAVKLLRGLSTEEVQTQLQAQVSEAQVAVQGQLSEALEAAEAGRTEAVKMVETILPELAQAPDLVQAKAAELGELAQEQVQAIGSSLWQWSQDISNQLSADGEAPVLDDITQKAQEHFMNLQLGLQQVGEELHKALEGPQEGPPRPRRRDGKRKGEKRTIKPLAARAGAELDDELDEEEPRRGPPAGLIRKQEEKMLAKSLLDGSDDEDEEQDAVQMARAAMAKQAGAPKLPPPVVDLLGDSSPAQAARPGAATAVPQDLLDDFNPNLPIVEPVKEEPLPRVAAPSPEAAPVSCAAASAAPSLMDFMAQDDAAAAPATAARPVDPLDLLTGDLLAC